MHSISSSIKAASWADLRKARQTTCTTVNKSMQSFFVRLRPNSLTADIDLLLDDLKTGTRFTKPLCERCAMHSTASIWRGRGSNIYNSLPQAMGKTNRTASPRIRGELRKNRWIEKNPTRSRSSQSFSQATESTFSGNRRVKILCHLTALRKVSRRSRSRNSHSPRRSYRLLRTNQKTPYRQQIFENLVPTVREQRSSRQFIIASHDANVVVSGDVERVIVLPPEASEQPTVGTLFDAAVRQSAITLLEGGDRAFQLRQKRYGDYV